MRHIRTLADLQQLEHSGSIPTPMFEVVRTYFHQLRESCGIESLGHVFELDSGHIVVVESSDEEAALCRLLSSWPEYAETLALDSGTVTKVVVLEDNDYIMTYFITKGDHPVIDAWLEQYLE